MSETFARPTDAQTAQCAPGYRVGPCVRNVYILHYVARGRGMLERGGKVWPVSAGQVFFIRPWEPVCYYADEADPWEYAWVNFTGEESEALIAATAFGRVPVTPPLPAGAEELFAALRGLGRGAAAECEGAGRLKVLLAYLMRAHPAERADAEKDDMVSLAVERMRLKYYDSDFGIAQLAAELGVSRSHLYRLFARETGMPPKEYLRQLRLERARELVRASALSVKEIAYSVGYADALYFSSEYRRTYGRSPREDRRRTV